MKRSTLMLLLSLWTAGSPLLAHAGRKIPTGKGQYGIGGDTDAGAHLVVSNATGQVITFTSSYKALGFGQPSAVFYLLHFNQAVASPIEVDVDVPFEPAGSQPDAGPAFGLAFEQLGNGNLDVHLAPCSTATASSFCAAGTACACAEATLVDPSGGTSPLRFFLDSTRLPGAPASFTAGDELVLYFADLSGKDAILRPAGDFVAIKSGGQALSFDGGDAYTLNVSIPKPVVTAISPSSRLRGLTLSGLDVTGTGFIDGVAGGWDSIARTGHFLSPTSMRVDLLPGDSAVAGAHQFTAVNPSHPDAGGPSTPVGFEVRVPQLTPSSGDITGGTQVTVVGVNFDQLASVSVGGSAPTGLVVASATQLSFTTPAHAAGTVDVQFLTDAGVCVADGGFRYLGAGGGAGGGSGGGGSTGGGTGGSGGGSTGGGTGGSGGGGSTGGGTGGSGGGGSTGGGTGGSGGGGSTGGGTGGTGGGAMPPTGCGCSEGTSGAALLGLGLLGLRRRRAR